MAKSSATSWVRSTITEKEVEKATANGLITAEDSIKFPSTERIPKPPSSYWVMFLAFLFRGLSLPAHEFLRGLLFVYGVQLHQLTPNSLLHIACFVTLCESFLGIEPHFTLWRSIFQLCPNVSLARKPELGGAIVSVHPEAQYLEFSMAASVQGWRTKWFYIKDRKSSPEAEFGLPPFDTSQEVKKLKSWDSLPSDAEVAQILPLLSRIKTLKTGLGGALSGIQHMAFFIQRRVQPLQHRLTKLWTYAGLEDPTRISEDLMLKEDVDKRVRNLTKLTKEHSVADLKADFFDAVHPLPEVYIATSTFYQAFLSFDLHYPLHLCFANLFIRRVINSLFLVLLFRRQGPYQMILLILHLKPPRLTKVRTEMMSKNQKLRLTCRHLLLPLLLKMLLSTKNGNVSTTSLPRVLRRLEKPLLK
jgi:hypothetical protein